MFGQPTDELLRLAHIDEMQRRKLTKEQRILLVLRDGEWHSGRELATVVSHRFGGYLHTLKTKGVEWQCERDHEAPKGESWHLYRLTKVGAPPSLF